MQAAMRAIASTRPSAGRSEAAARSRWRAAGAVLLGLTMALATAAATAEPLSRDEALALAFPGCRVERRTEYPTAAQLDAARRLAEVEIPSVPVHAYRAHCPDGPGGTAYFDVHRVRTLPETLMVVVTPDGTVGRLEVLSFAEPGEYRPRPGWYEQFRGRRLDAGLRLDRGVRRVVGATLTSRATTEAVRRVLALDRVLSDGDGDGTARDGDGDGG